VLGSLLLGAVAGSLLRIEDRLEGLAGRVQAFVHRRLPAVDVSAEGEAPSATRGTSGAARPPDEQPGMDRRALEPRERFIEGWLTASLLFCVGPLTILGSLSDGMGRGSEQLVLKSVLDGFAALAFASTFGIGVLMSALSVLVIQGGLTLLGVFLQTLLPGAHVAALTATGGLLLAAIGLRLLRIRDIPVGDLLPALAVAPLLTQLVIALR
jgi:uncharacterized membrane protein YqgA involved in biofilm formation